MEKIAFPHKNGPGNYTSDLRPSGSVTILRLGLQIVVHLWILCLPSNEILEFPDFQTVVCIASCLRHGPVRFNNILQLQQLEAMYGSLVAASGRRFTARRGEKSVDAKINWGLVFWSRRSGGDLQCRDSGSGKGMSAFV